MDKREAIRLAKEYANIVIKNMIVNKIILYGSYARGNLNSISEYGEVVYAR